MPINSQSEWSGVIILFDIEFCNVGGAPPELTLWIYADIFASTVSAMMHTERSTRGIIYVNAYLSPYVVTVIERSLPIWTREHMLCKNCAYFFTTKCRQRALICKYSFHKRGDKLTWGWQTRSHKDSTTRLFEGSFLMRSDWKTLPSYLFVKHSPVCSKFISLFVISHDLSRSRSQRWK